MYWNIINMFSNILQKISFKNSLLWKSQNDHKRIAILRAFVIVDLFDYDLTHHMIRNNNIN
jgi:hypothetical protein